MSRVSDSQSRFGNQVLSLLMLMLVLTVEAGEPQRNDLGTSYAFVPDKSESGRGDHVIKSSARPSDQTAFDQPGRRVELIISSPKLFLLFCEYRHMKLVMLIGYNHS